MFLTIKPQAIKTHGVVDVFIYLLICSLFNDAFFSITTLFQLLRLHSVE
jgi:hypothetical protein